MHYDFVVFLDADWSSTIHKNRQHFLIRQLARQLEGQSEIVAVERPICPWTNPFRKRKKFVQWLRGERGLRQAASNLYIYTPFVLLHNVIAARVPGLTVLNQGLLRLLLRRVLKKLGLRTANLVGWIHHPYQLEDMGLVDERCLIYDCYDDYIAGEQDPFRRRDLQWREQQILRRADLVLVASVELLKAKSKGNGNVCLVPNGVEWEHFAQAARSAGDSAVTQYDAPVLGFIGKITPRLDFRVLSQLARRHPDWVLVMIGRQERGRELLSDPHYRAFVAAANVHLQGALPYPDLPAYMEHFDVCLLPYTADDPFNVNCSPLKLYEYLATGKPIVSTDLPAVRPFRELVHIALDADQFEQQVVAALADDRQDLSQRRLAAAQQNSWDKRAAAVLNAIDASVARGEIR